MRQVSRLYVTCLAFACWHTCVAMCCSVLQCAVVCCSVLPSVALCCNVMQCVAMCCSVSFLCRMRDVSHLYMLSVCCGVLHCVATCCNVMQCLVFMRMFFQMKLHMRHAHPPGTDCNALQHTARPCNTLQHTATHSNKL